MSLEITFGKSKDKNVDFDQLSKLLCVDIQPSKSKILITFSNHEKITQWCDIVNNQVFPFAKKIPIGKLSDSGMKKRNIFSLPQPIYDMIEHYHQRKIRWKNDKWNVDPSVKKWFVAYSSQMKKIPQFYGNEID